LVVAHHLYTHNPPCEPWLVRLDIGARWFVVILWCPGLTIHPASRETHSSGWQNGHNVVIIDIESKNQKNKLVIENKRES
jgi:hypothetical protein